MIISWSDYYPNSEYLSAGLYSTNGLCKYTYTAPSTAADGVYFTVNLGGGLMYLKRVA